MKKLIKLLLYLIFFVIFSSQLIFAQKIKKYNGPFVGNHTVGKATYGYYEKGYDRVWNGSYSYIDEKNKFTIKGNYKNNLKNGLWKATVKNYYYDGFLADYWITASVTGNFVEGNKIGKWTFSRKRIVKPGSSTKFWVETFSDLLGEKEKLKEKITKLESSLANFKDNHLLGDFSYNSYFINEKNSKTSLKGYFNENGFVDSIWEFKSSSYKDIRKYKNGFLYWRLKRDNRTGEIIEKFDKTDFINTFLKQYDSTENFALIKDTVWVIKNLKVPNQPDKIYDILKLWNENEYTKSGGVTDGIYLYEIHQGSNDTSTIFYFKELESYPTDYGLGMELKKKYLDNKRFIKFMKQADSLFKNNKFELALDKYYGALFKQDSLLSIKINTTKNIIYNKHIKNADVLFQNQKYDLAKKAYYLSLEYKDADYPKKQLSKIRDINYERIILVADSLFNKNKYIDAKSVYNQALEIKDEDYPHIQINKIRDIRYENYIIYADSLFYLKKLDDARNSYSDAFSVKNENYPEKQIDLIRKLSYFISDIKIKHKRITVLYGEKPKQETLYTTYLNIHTEIINNYMIEYEKLQKLIHLQNKVSELHDFKTKKLKRDLKKESDIFKQTELILSFEPD